MRKSVNGESDKVIRKNITNPPKRKTQSHHDTSDSIVAKKYDTSNGYPKGLPDGPEAIVSIKGKRTIIHGTPWEKLNEEIRKDLDERPLDEAGELRIFIPDTYEVGSYIEMGSKAKAEKFRQHLDEMKKKLL